MSFRCSHCKVHHPAPESPVRIVTGYKDVPVTSDGNPITKLPDGVLNRETHRTVKMIAGEAEVCVSCAYKLQPENPEVMRRMAYEQTKQRRVMNASQTEAMLKTMGPLISDAVAAQLSS